MCSSMHICSLSFRSEPDVKGEGERHGVGGCPVPSDSSVEFGEAQEFCHQT